MKWCSSCSCRVMRMPCSLAWHNLIDALADHLMLGRTEGKSRSGGSLPSAISSTLSLSKVATQLQPACLRCGVGRRSDLTRSIGPKASLRGRKICDVLFKSISHHTPPFTCSRTRIANQDLLCGAVSFAGGLRNGTWLGLGAILLKSLTNLVSWVFASIPTS